MNSTIVSPAMYDDTDATRKQQCSPGSIWTVNRLLQDRTDLEFSFDALVQFKCIWHNGFAFVAQPDLVRLREPVRRKWKALCIVFAGQTIRNLRPETGHMQIE